MNPDSEGDQFVLMSGLSSGGETYDANLDALAVEMIYGLGNTPIICWPAWLRIRAQIRHLA